MKSDAAAELDWIAASKGQSAQVATGVARGTPARRAVVASVSADSTTVTTTDGIQALRMVTYQAPTAGDTIVLTQSTTGAWYAMDRIASTTDADPGWTSYTPTVTGGTVTWSTRDGWWRRIAPKLVVVDLYLVASAVGSGSNLMVSLPTAPYRGGANRRQTVPGYAGGLSSGNGPCVGLVLAGGTGAMFDQIRSAADTSITGAMCTASTVITLTGLYREA